MTLFELNRSLASMVLLVDTREQPTKRLKRRLEDAGLPYERKKLNVGIIPANAPCQMGLNWTCLTGSPLSEKWI